MAGMGIIFVGCGQDGVHFCRLWPSRKLPWPRGFTINAQVRPCKNVSVALLFCFIPVCYSVAAERNSELSVFAGVGVVLWLLFCLFPVSLILISRCLNVLG